MDDYFKSPIGFQKGGKNRGSQIKMDFPQSILIKDCADNTTNVFYLNTIVGTIDTQKRIFKLDRQKALIDGICPILAYPKLLGNYTYIICDGRNIHELRIDVLGRCIFGHFEINNKTNYRSPSEQTKALQFKDGEVRYPSSNKLFNKYNDEGGHIMPASAGGLPEVFNILAESYNSNCSQKRSMERSLSEAVNQNQKVIVDVIFNYDGESLRSSNSNYKVVIDGCITDYEFTNLNLEISEEDSLIYQRENHI